MTMNRLPVPEDYGYSDGGLHLRDFVRTPNDVRDGSLLITSPTTPKYPRRDLVTIAPASYALEQAWLDGDI